MFPVLSPRAPTRRSIRGQNALEKAVAEATKDHPYLQQLQLQNQQPKELQFQIIQPKEEISGPTLVATVCAVSVPYTGMGSGHTCKMLDMQDTPPPLDPRHVIIPQVKQATSGDRKKLTSRVKNLPQAASLLAGQSSRSSQERLSQPSLGPIRMKRKRRSR